MGDGTGSLIMVILIIALVIFIVYLIIMITSIILGILATAGTVWGGGKALKNYYTSFKKNMIDSNRKEKTA